MTEHPADPTPPDPPTTPPAAREIRYAASALIHVVADVTSEPGYDPDTHHALADYAEGAAEYADLPTDHETLARITSRARHALALASGVPPRLAPMLTDAQWAEHLRTGQDTRVRWLERAGRILDGHRT